MKIASINSVYQQGSTGRIMSDLLQVSALQGHETFAFYGRGKKVDQSNHVESHYFSSAIGLATHLLGSRLTGRHGFFSKKDTIRLISELDKINPDLIHLHNIHGYYIHIPTLFSYLETSEVPVIWTLHDCWAFTGHCAYYDSVGCMKWMSSCHDCPQINTYPKSYKDASQMNFLDKKRIFTSLANMIIVTPSTYLAGEVKKSFLSSYEVQVIKNGIDTSIFKPDEKLKFVNNKKTKFLAVASPWTARKGLVDLFALAKMLEKDEELIIIGLSDEQIRNAPGNVTARPKTSSVDELVKQYQSADILLNPTYEDNYPTVNIEAIACGLPVVTYETGGSPESATMLPSGSVVKKGNVEAMLLEARRIKNDHDLIMSTFKWAQDNRDLVSGSKMVSEYLELFSRVI